MTFFQFFKNRKVLRKDRVRHWLFSTFVIYLIGVLYFMGGGEKSIQERLLLFFDLKIILALSFLTVLPLFAILLEEIIRYRIALEKSWKFENTDNYSYEQKLSNLIKNLKNSSDDLQISISEITEFTEEKSRIIEKLNFDLSKLNSEESKLKLKIATMEKVPIEAVKYFEEVLNKGDKRSAFRDYILFFSGIIVSQIISLVLKYYFKL